VVLHGFWSREFTTRKEVGTLVIEARVVDSQWCQSGVKSPSPKAEVFVAEGVMIDALEAITANFHIFPRLLALPQAPLSVADDRMPRSATRNSVKVLELHVN
jgi:hypothetical protein